MENHKHDWSWANDVHCTTCGEAQDTYIEDLEADLEDLEAEVARLHAEVERLRAMLTAEQRGESGWSRVLTLQDQSRQYRRLLRDIVSAYDGAKVHASVDLDAAVDRVRAIIAPYVS